MATARQILDRARTIVGSYTKLAKAIKYSDAAIQRAIERDRISPEMACNIEVATKGQITRLEIRPDVFGNPAKTIKHAWRD